MMTFGRVSQNLSFCAVLQEIRLLDREYFKFLFRLVKRKAEEPFSPPSSMRRTEPSSSSSMVCPDSPDHVSSRREVGADEAAERLIELAALFLFKVRTEKLPTTLSGCHHFKASQEIA